MSSQSRAQLLGTLVQLRGRVDDHFSRAIERTPDDFACRAGCSACCGQRFGVFEAEAEPIRVALRNLGAKRPGLREAVRRQAAGHEPACPLLVEDRCVVYEARPLICRSHGLPVASEDEDGSLGIDNCPLNFTDPDRPAPRESVLMLDAINRPLSVLAQLWDGGGARIELSELALEGADHDGGAPTPPSQAD